MIIVQNKFDWADIVYLSTDEFQFPRLVTGIRITPDGGIIYNLRCGVIVSEHYEFEITEEKNFVKA